MTTATFIPLDILKYTVSTRVLNNERQLLDEVRKKWLVMTPEELVRQHFVQFLLKEKKYPASLMKIEHPLNLNDLKKRSDIVVYTREGKPWLLVECKAAQIKLTQDTLDQAARYNIKLGVEYLMVCNGIEALAVKYSGEDYMFIDFIPEYGS